MNNIFAAGQICVLLNSNATCPITTSESEQFFSSAVANATVIKIESSLTIMLYGASAFVEAYSKKDTPSTVFESIQSGFSNSYRIHQIPLSLDNIIHLCSEFDSSKIFRQVGTTAVFSESGGAIKLCKE